MDEKILQKISKGREYRNMTVEVAEYEDEKIVRGYATTFEQPYDLYSFKDKDGARHVVREQVARDAFRDTDMSDVIMQYDHEGRVFARTSNDTLKLTADDHGLQVNAYLGGTEIGKQLYGEIKGGYTNKMSFGFRVGSDDIQEEEADGKVIYTRTIRSFAKLYDVSAVSLPANDGTEISARSLRDGEIARLEAERLVKAERAKVVKSMIERIDKILGRES